MDADEQPQNEALLRAHRRTLRLLKEQQANFGPYTPTYILAQIEDIQSEIDLLEAKLGIEPSVPKIDTTERELLKRSAQSRLIPLSSTITLNILSYVLILFLPVLVYGALHLLCPLWSSDPIALASGIIIIIAPSLLLLSMKLPDAHKMFALTVAAIAIGASGYSLVLFCSQPLGAAYLIIDASENTKGFSQEIGARAILSADALPDSVQEIGLIVFGGGISSSAECNDIAQLVEPSPRPTSIPAIEKRAPLLNQIDPQGPRALQEAILQSIDRLAGRREIQMIFVITALSDKHQCEALQRDILDLKAAQHNLKYKLVIITVGSYDEADEANLKSTADFYNHVGSVDEVPSVIETTIIEFRKLYYGS